MKFPAAEVAEVYGGMDREESEVTLSAGWNMIGGPNCNVELSSVVDPGGVIIPGTLYKYTGSYIASTTIDGTKAYWVKASAGGTITISCSTSVAGVNESNYLAKLEKATDSFSQIEVTDAEGKQQRLYFNGRIDEGVSIESYSMPPKAPEGSFDARLAGDYRLTESDEATIQIQSSKYPFKLKVKHLKSNEGYELREIADGVEVGTRRIEDGEEIVIGNEEVNIVKIMKEESLPTVYNLEQNYPNPFNPSTTIKFTLPEATNVRLRIYNTLGERVGEVVNTNLEAGWYSYQWDATNLSTGIYIYELRTDKFISVKKMILIK